MCASCQVTVQCRFISSFCIIATICVHFIGDEYVQIIYFTRHFTQTHFTKGHFEKFSKNKSSKNRWFALLMTAFIYWSSTVQCSYLLNPLKLLLDCTCVIVDNVQCWGGPVSYLPGGQGLRGALVPILRQSTEESLVWHREVRVLTCIWLNRFLCPGCMQAFSPLWYGCCWHRFANGSPETHKSSSPAPIREGCLTHPGCLTCLHTCGTEALGPRLGHFL